MSDTSHAKNVPVITRFAPSPTGMLHIGGVRTALMNWLFAHRHGGKYVVRIEDTDHKRTAPEAVPAITEGLQWLGIAGDQPIVLQSERLERHRQAALALLESGRVYYCDCSNEDIAEQRRTARAAGRTRMYDRRCRGKGLTSGVLRVAMPTTGKTVLNDAVQGNITVNNDHLDDYVLLRSDGTPTYMLSCVVDDADMGITHVIRGDDHTINAFRQYHLLHAMGYIAPTYAHIGLLHGSDGSKLSKRHGALGIAHYRDAGYLPEALNNYLMGLGWSKGAEILSLETASSLFSLSDVSKSAAQIDFQRLDHMNARYLRKWAQQQPQKLANKLAEFARTPLDAKQQRRLCAGLPGLSIRAEKLTELWQSAQFYFNPVEWPLSDHKAQSQFLKKAHDADFPGLAESMQRWTFADRDDIRTSLEKFIATMGIGFGQVGQPLRIALAGTMQAPEIQDILFVLGKEETLTRINAAYRWWRANKST